MSAESAAYGYPNAQAIGPSSRMDMRRALSGLVSTIRMRYCVLTSARDRPPINHPHAQRPTQQVKLLALRGAPREIGPKRRERRLGFFPRNAAAVLRPRLEAAYGYLTPQALSGLVSTTRMSNCVLTSARDRPPKNKPRAQRPTQQVNRRCAGLH